MSGVWIVYRGDEGAEILGVFRDQKEATQYTEYLADEKYPGERIWVGGYPVPYRATDEPHA